MLKRHRLAFDFTSYLLHTGTTTGSGVLAPCQTLGHQDDFKACESIDSDRPLSTSQEDSFHRYSGLDKTCLTIHIRRVSSPK